MSTRATGKGHATPVATGGKRLRAIDPVPTVDEAKRRLAAAAGREQPWLRLTPEFKAAMAEAEDAAGGRLAGPELYRPSDAE